MCLTIHFVDKIWKLNKIIMEFRLLPILDCGKTISQAVEMCFLGWGIQNLCTITVDNASLNNVAALIFRRNLILK